MNIATIGSGLTEKYGIEDPCESFGLGYEEKNEYCGHCWEDCEQYYSKCKELTLNGRKWMNTKMVKEPKKETKKETKKEPKVKKESKSGFIIDLLKKKTVKFDDLCGSLVTKFGGKTGNKNNVKVFLHNIGKKHTLVKGDKGLHIE